LHLQALQEPVERPKSIGDHGRQTASGGEQLPPGLLYMVQALDAAMFIATGSFTRLKTSFLEFKEKLESGGGIKCNGVAFKTQHDFLKWFEEEGPTIDIFLDGIAYMHGISSPIVYSDDAIKQIELQMKRILRHDLKPLF
jgi:hypothetical protein